MIEGLPFLTLPDPEIEAEGALDPLGLSSIGDRLAEDILPGLRARMSRPRFLTAVAVSAAVCDGLEDKVAADQITPAYLVFEWLLVEGFVRAGGRETTVGTPGTLKGQAAKIANDGFKIIMGEQYDVDEARPTVAPSAYRFLRRFSSNSQCGFIPMIQLNRHPLLSPPQVRAETCLLAAFGLEVIDPSTVCSVASRAYSRELIVLLVGTMASS